MSALYLTLFVSLMLVALFVAGFVHGVYQRDHDHLDRLSLLPLDDDAGPDVPGPDAHASVEDHPDE